ncbi:MAG TPA: serine hydrolase [Fimbriimonas sp.]
MALAAIGALLLLGGGGMQARGTEGVADAAAEAALRKYADKGVKADEIGIALCRLDGKRIMVLDGYRQDEAMYPASVVKLFYLTYLAHQLEKGRLKKTDEIERAAKDMIVESDNDATNWILEILTGATSGPELDASALKRWMSQRQAVNRYFSGLGYKDVNACQKTWYSGPYGRERQGYGPNFEHRNSLTPSACTRLLSEIMTDRLVSPARCEWMRGYLSRKIPADSKDADSQSKGYSGQALPSGTKLWSKAGWTETVKHDVAAVETKDGRRFVWAIFTKSHSDIADLVPFIAGELLKGLL